jgi:hypothetical protein
VYKIDFSAKKTTSHSFILLYRISSYYFRANKLQSCSRPEVETIFHEYFASRILELHLVDGDLIQEHTFFVFDTLMVVMTSTLIDTVGPGCWEL